MRITLNNVSTRESQQSVKIQAIRSWDTIQYLSMLDGLYQDAIFHEQLSNLPEEYIKLDEMAKDEKKNSLNIYDFFLSQLLRLYVKLLNQHWIFIIRIVQPSVGWLIIK